MFEAGNGFLIKLLTGEETINPVLNSRYSTLKQKVKFYMNKNEISEMPKSAKKIKNSKDYADVDGQIYTYVSNYKGLKTNKVVRKTQTKSQGYMYCGIYDNKTKRAKTRRVNRVIAETFLPNPNNYDVVGHRNNIKTDNRVENLYWTTCSGNTKKAVEDGLLKNDKGEEDSQSKPVIMYETNTNKLLGRYGSCKEAARITGLSLTTICRQAKYHRPVRKPYYFRFVDDDSVSPNDVICMKKYDTDEIVGEYWNTNEASRQTGYNPKTISQQCNKGKPKVKRSEYYYEKRDKCEQTIESSKDE